MVFNFVLTLTNFVRSPVILSQFVILEQVLFHFNQSNSRNYLTLTISYLVVLAKTYVTLHLHLKSLAFTTYSILFPILSI